MKVTTKSTAHPFALYAGSKALLSLSQALELSRKWNNAVVVPNEWGRFDIALPDGCATSADTLFDVDDDLRSRGYLCYLALNAEGVEEKFSTAHKGCPSPAMVNIQCVLCEGSGERAKWDSCPECYGRCEVQYSDSYDSYGYPIWGYATCRSCNGAGGTNGVYRCGFCEGDGFVEVAESALMESDMIVKEMVVVV